MLKWYADTFKLGTTELTSKRLNQLKLYTLLGLPSVFLFPFMFVDVLPSRSIPLVAIIFLISAVFFTMVMLSPFTNRFWARDKYLDEWERGRKHHGMAIGFQVTDYIFAGLGAIFFVLSFFIEKTITLNLASLGGILIYLVCLMVLIPHIFLLWTVKPVDVSGEEAEESFKRKAQQDLRIWVFGSVLIISGFIFGFLTAMMS